MSIRVDLLESLIHFKQPIAAIMEQLYQFPFDTGYSYATLTRENIISILNRFMSNELTAMDVCEWAEALEGRICSDVERELGYSELINNVLNFLSTDQRSGYALTAEDAKQEINRLTYAAPDKKDEPGRTLLPKS